LKEVRMATTILSVAIVSVAMAQTVLVVVRLYARARRLKVGISRLPSGGVFIDREVDGSTTQVVVGPARRGRGGRR
jgi:Flp pilus assembly protein TadB